MSWYRTYRPTTLAGLHLTDVRANLLRLLDSNQFPHALLFAGPKGTGKTSAARIMSAILNDPDNADAVEQLFFAKSEAGKSSKKVQLHEPDQTSEIVQRIQRGSSFAVQELDAASNRGIDDIRQLKERIYLQPQEGKISVYILDEVHMLTTEAFNALLKLLEEPPVHVVFILATTELHKLPETVVSRTTVIRFHTASTAELSAALTAILTAEKITFSPTAVTQIAQLAEGSFRDAVKLLEQAAAGKTALTDDDLSGIFQLSSTKQQLALVDAISQKDAPAVVKFFADLRSRNTNEQFFYHGWLLFLHQQLLMAISPATAADTQPQVPQKISHYLLTQFHHLAIDTVATIPFLSLELKSLEIVFKAKERDGGGGDKKTGGEVMKVAGNVSSLNKPKALQADSVRANLIDSEEPRLIPDRVIDDQLNEIANVVPVAVVDYRTDVELNPFEDQEKSYGSDQVLSTQGISEVDTKSPLELVASWTQILTELRKSNLTLEAMLRSATPKVSPDGRALIEVYYTFHREQLDQPKFRRIFEDCVCKVLGGRVQLEFVLAQKNSPTSLTSTVSLPVNEASVSHTAQDDPLIQLAKDILV